MSDKQASSPAPPQLIPELYQPVGMCLQRNKLVFLPKPASARRASLHSALKSQPLGREHPSQGASSLGR